MNIKSMVLAIALAAAACAPPAHGAANAQQSQSQSVRVRVAGVPLGSGLPSSGPVPQDAEAEGVADGDFHAPGMLPGHPTAAPLWPRVVHVPCRRDAAAGGDLRCAGYDVSPTRGEYIYVRPVMVAPPPEPAPAPRRPRPAAPHKKPLG